MTLWTIFFSLYCIGFQLVPVPKSMFCQSFFGMGSYLQPDALNAFTSPVYDTDYSFLWVFIYPISDAHLYMSSPSHNNIYSARISACFKDINICLDEGPSFADLLLFPANPAIVFPCTLHTCQVWFIHTVIWVLHFLINTVQHQDE